MKKLVFLSIVLMCSMIVLAQNPVVKRDSLMNKARLMTMQKSKHYNPEEAFAIYNQKAQEGNAEAMNALGLLYSKGEGILMNEEEGLKWIEASTRKGYPKAWYNLGMMYKNGLGTKQDFAKAFECFSKGAALSDGNSYYGQGYMYYKGFGCEQNYEKAFAAFIKSAKKWNVNAMFFLGISYRNGFGASQNVDSARYWLNRAAKYKHSRAIEELNSITAEYTGIKEVPKLQTNSSSQANIIDAKKGYKKVTHYLPAGNTEGEYAGYAIKFDWSGKHIIATPELKMKLKIKGKELEAEWKEGDAGPIKLTGTITDTSVVFKDIVYEVFDHYNKKQPNQVRMEAAVLQLAKSNGQTIITGNMERYSLTHKEPEKPMFIMLVNTGGQLPDEQEADSLKFTPYPNPFTNSFQLSYTLKEQSQVNIIVSSVLNGKIVYSSAPQLQHAGEHSHTIAVNAAPGYYVVTLKYGNKLKSAIINKQ